MLYDKKLFENSNKVLRYIRNQVTSEEYKIIVLCICSAVSACSSVMQAMATRKFVDYAVEGDKHKFLVWIGIFFGLIFFGIVVNVVIKFLSENTVVSIQNHFQKHSFEVFLSTKYEFIEKYHTGNLLNRLTNDAAIVSQNLVWMPSELISTVTRLLAAFIYLTILEWKLTVIMVFCMLALILGALPFRGVMKKYHKNIMEKDGYLRSFFQEMLENSIVIRSFELLPQTVGEAENRMKLYKKARMKRVSMSVGLNTIGICAINLAYLIGLGWCGLGIINGRITFGTLSAVWQLIGQITGPARQITGIFPKYFEMTASAERLMEMEDYPKEEADVNNHWNEIADRFQTMELNHVTFSYNKKGAEVSVLNDFNYEIHRGDYIAIMGESGTGKSTLLKLLLSIYEARDDAELLFRMKDGSDVKLDIGGRAVFAYVPQGNYLMSGTIWNAIHFGSLEKLDKERVRWACSVAAAEEFINHLPAGYDTVIGEKGAGLSEGQVQRLAIARAVYSQKPILLLDECTSALDENTEMQVLNQLRNMTDRTVLIVTHRKAVLNICNRVMYI